MEYRAILSSLMEKHPRMKYRDLQKMASRDLRESRRFHLGDKRYFKQHSEPYNVYPISGVTSIPGLFKIHEGNRKTEIPISEILSITREIHDLLFAMNTDIKHEHGELTHKKIKKYGGDQGKLLLDEINTLYSWLPIIEKQYGDMDKKYVNDKLVSDFECVIALIKTLYRVLY